MKLDNLKALRKKRGYTRDELAKISGVSAVAIKFLEQGNTNAENVKLSTLTALAKGLKCRLLDLLPVEYSKKQL